MEEKKRFKISFRGVGLDTIDKCFVCGCETPSYTNNISGFVKSKEAGEEINSLFLPGSSMVDFRENEPEWIQVKIGACDHHINSLHELSRLGRGGDIMIRDIRLSQIVPAKFKDGE